MDSLLVLFLYVHVCGVCLWACVCICGRGLCARVCMGMLCWGVRERAPTCHSPGRDQRVAAGVLQTCLSCVLLSWGHQASCPRLLGDSPVSAQVLLQECQDWIPHPTTSSCHTVSGAPCMQQMLLFTEPFPQPLVGLFQ